MNKSSRLIIIRDGKQELDLDVVIPELKKKLLAGSNPAKPEGGR